MTLRMRLGMFDPLEDQPYAQIPLSEFSSASSAQLNADMTAQGLVLLQNKGVLPFAQVEPGAGPGAGRGGMVVCVCVGGGGERVRGSLDVVCMGWDITGSLLAC
jgi:hypothetical protein